MRWAKLADTVRAHPGRVMLIALAILVPPALFAPQTKLSFNVLSELPASADSVQGYDALAGHFQRGDVSPVILVLRHDESMWNDASFRALNDMTVAIGKIPGVALVRSLTQPTGGVFTEEDLKEAGVDELQKFPDRLQEGADGVGQVLDGLGQIRAGLVRMRDELPRLRDGLAEGSGGVDRMRDGIKQMRDGIRRMIDGLTEAANGLSKPGADNDLADAATTARDRLESALAKMHPEGNRSVVLPQYLPVYEDVATAYGAITGIDDTTGRPATRPGAEDYAKRGGMPKILRTIGDGLREAVAGLRKIDDGLVQIDDGLARLGPGLREGADGVRQTVDGVVRMIGGLDLIDPGLTRLRVGLAEGAARVRSSGIADAATAGNLGLTPKLIEAIPGLRQRLGFFITEDEKTVRFFVTLDREPYAGESLAAVKAMREVGGMSLNNSPLEGTPVLTAGSASFFEDIRGLSSADFRTIMIAVLVGIFIVLALLLRSIVAPVYLILTVLLSFVTTLGLTALVFQVGFGQPGIPWWLPPFLFVMLVALGADYNIFLMSRIREEARRHTTADATARGLALTGHVITSAGLILAGTFAALLAAPLRSLQQYGFAVTVGILLDTFVVRSLLVPSIATLLGRHNWWPSRRAAAP